MKLRWNRYLSLTIQRVEPNALCGVYNVKCVDLGERQADPGMDGNSTEHDSNGKADLRGKPEAIAPQERVVSGATCGIGKAAQELCGFRGAGRAEYFNRQHG